MLEVEGLIDKADRGAMCIGAPNTKCFEAPSPQHMDAIVIVRLVGSVTIVRQILDRT